MEEVSVRILVSKQDKDKINRLCEVIHKDLNDLFREFLNNFITPEKYEQRRGLEEASFNVRKYKVTVSPVIEIEGSTSVDFRKWEVKDKAWHRNVKLPNYLKEFLDNLSMEIQKQGE